MLDMDSMTSDPEEGKSMINKDVRNVNGNLWMKNNGILWKFKNETNKNIYHYCNG